MQRSVLEEFADDCRCRDFSNTTIQTYRCNIRYFLDFQKCDHNQLFDDFEIRTDYDKLKLFLKHLKKRNLTASTINGYFSAISTFYDFLYEFEKTEKNEIPAFRRRYLKQKKKFNYYKRRQLIDKSTMKELVDEPLITEPFMQIKNYIRTVPERDRAIAIMFAKSGIRKEECRMMERSDLNVDDGEIFVKPEFAKRTQCIGFIDEEAIDILQDYLVWRKSVVKPGNNRLFVTHKGSMLRKDDLYYITTFYASKIGIHNPLGEMQDKFTPHCYRHWFTTNLRRSGMSREMRMWLRGDAPQGADDWYDHVEPWEVRPHYLRHIPKLWK
nr:tyrosine-type recombinase/integrase [uncultured Methanolobus sp.]